MENTEKQKRFGKKASAATILAVIAITITLLGVGLYYPALEQFNTFTIHYEFHCWIEHWRDGELISRTYHALTLTTYGKNQMEQLLGGEVTDAFKYHGCSNNETAVDVAWTALPDEIVANGLERSVATYANTGDGTWNMTNTWTASGSQSACLYGVYSESSGSNLCLAEQQGSGNRKNLISGDTLKMTVQGTVS